MKKMLSVERFKDFVEEVSRILGLFEMHDCYSLDLLKEYYSKGYDPNNLFYYYKRILKYDPSQEIEDDIIGDGKYDEYAGRLKTVRFKLGVGTERPYIGIEANVDLFYKEKNPELYQALIAINDGDKETAFWTMERLRQIATVSNIIIGQVKKMLDDIDNRLINDNNTAEATTPDTSTIKDLMLLDSNEQKQSFLDVLHKLIRGNKGKHVALVILVCEKCGLLQKPTHQILVSTFGDIGSRQGYNNYYSKGLSAYTSEQIKGIERHILPFIDSN